MAGTTNETKRRFFWWGVCLGLATGMLYVWLIKKPTPLTFAPVLIGTLFNALSIPRTSKDA